MSTLNLDTLGLQPDPGDPQEGNPAPAPATEAAPAIPPAPPAPEPEEEIEVPEGAENPDAVKTLIQAERAAARAAYKRARDAEAKLAEITEAALPVEQRLTAAQQRATEAELRATKLEIGLDLGLPKTFAQMLQGSNESEIKANAEAVFAELNKRNAAPSVPGLSLNGGAQHTPPPATNPAMAHNNFLLNLIGGQRPGA